jgi:arylsulfatase A-like enzyme
MDELAVESAVCDRLYCAALPTQPSFTTLYTGQHPIRHGIVCHGGDAELSKDAPSLPGRFLEAGYTTCAVDNLRRARPWLGRGWEFYIDPSIRLLLPMSVSCDEMNARAVAWLRAHAHERFFMLVHYWDPHDPFNPPERFRSLFYRGNPYDPANRSLEAWWRHPAGALARETWLRRDGGLVTDAEYVAALYDQEIRYVDEGIGLLLEAVEDIGLVESTLVVVTADHGESMTEHGIFFEHHGLYDCTLRVPFLVRWPGRVQGGVRVAQMLQTPDIAPTVLEAAGLAPPGGLDGCSFWRLLTKDEEQPGHQRVVSAECSWQAKWSLRSDRYKFILAREPDFYQNPMRELYDLAADPGEERNIAEGEPQIATEMEEELEGWIAERLRHLGKTEDPLREQGVSLKTVWTHIGA